MKKVLIIAAFAAFIGMSCGQGKNSQVDTVKTDSIQVDSPAVDSVKAEVKK